MIYLMGVQIRPKYGETESTFFFKSLFNGRCSFSIVFSDNLMELGKQGEVC